MFLCKSCLSKSDRKYDVFLSFRGPDAREEFANPLHYALETEGVSAFLDRKSLETGEHISYVLEQSIKGSRIGIPILSKNFAQSKWCLRELSIMLFESIPIFPVFYGVLPSDLRDGGKLVQGLESKKERWPPEFIYNSKRALKRVSKIKGYCFSDFEKPDFRKSDLIRVIVKDVQRALRKLPLEYLRTPTCFGFEWQVDHLQKLLKVGNHQPKVVKVGIHGMNGIGKTALALIVCKPILHWFNVVCIVRDVCQRSEAHGLAKVQQAMLHDLYEFESQVDHVQHGKWLIEERLRGRNVLLLLDDIKTPEQLEALGGCFTHFGEGTRLLITTTERQILNVANVDEQYEVRKLQHNQALRLFTSHAFPNLSSPDQHLQTVCNEIVSACEGLPITLEVVAKELMGQRDISVWTSMIEKIRRHPDPHDKLKTCHESLNEVEKEIFQDIACIFEGTEKETATIFWEEEEWIAQASLERLFGKHMISFGSRNELLMHSCLRYLGRALARQIHMEPRKRTRFFGDSYPEGILGGFVGKARTRYLCYEPKEEKTLNAECFKSLTQLQLLWLSDVVIEGHFTDSHLRSLIWLRWRRYSSRCLPPGLNLGRLAILQVTEGQITHLWDDQSQHQQIRPWRLKVLVLSRCPVLESLPNTLNYKFLQILDLQNCESLRSLPSMAGFESLVSLNMEGCGVSSLPDDFGELPSLRELNLSRCKKLSKLPANFGNLSNLEELRIDHNGKLTKLPDSFGRLKALMCLEAGYCQLSDDGLPIGISDLTMLRVVNLGHNRFSRLHVDLKKLTQLSDLYLDGCTEVVLLPELPPSLRILNVSHCRCLTRVSGKWDLLISLDATMCDQLIGLYGSASLQNLTSLNLMGCKNISSRSLESCLGGLRSLECVFMGGAGITSIQLQIWYDSITKAISLLDERCDLLCTSDKPSSTWRFAEADGKKGDEKLCMDEQNEVRFCAGYIVCSVVFEDESSSSNGECRKRLGYSIERGEKQSEVIHPEMRVEGGSGHVLELRVVRDGYHNFEWLGIGSKLKVKAISDYDHWKAYFRFLMHQSLSSTTCNSAEETQPTTIIFGM